MLKIIPLILLVTLSGCVSINVTPPKKANIEKDQTYTLDYHSTWVQVIDWFADHDVIIDKIEKDSGLITAKHLLEADNVYLDCGDINISGSYNNSIEKVGSLNVTVRRADDKHTKVHVNFFGQFKYTGRDAWDGRHVSHDGRCVSTGAVEKSILSYIKE